MLATYFKDPRTLTAFRSGPAGSHLDHFIMWLEIHGYRRACIRRHAREAHRFAAWGQANGLSVRDLDQDTLHRFHNHLAMRKLLRKPNGDHSSAYNGSRVFVDFLEATGTVISCASHCVAESPDLLLGFMEWMRTQRGVRDSTLTRYRQPITVLLQDLGTDASTFNAKELRGFLLHHIASASKNKILPTAMRMFLRFLIARGLCIEVEKYLSRYANFAMARGDTHIVGKTAIEWASQASSENERARRSDMLIRFARFARAEDGRNDIPPDGVFCGRWHRRTPYIFTDDEVQRLIVSAGQLNPPGTLRPHTYSTLFGLLATTGLRISEALSLRFSDVTPEGLVIRETKFKKSRLVPAPPTMPPS